MPRRSVLTARQRATMFDLPTDEAPILRHYTLADDDLETIGTRRRPHNRLGFALQLCAFRYPGRLLAPGEVIPEQITRFLAAQLGLRSDDLIDYAIREETRNEHLATLREIYGYKMFTSQRSRDLNTWLTSEAEIARSNEGLAKRFVWLRQFEAGQNSADANRLLDRLEFLQDLNLDPAIFDGVPPHRITRLRRQGERYFAGDLRDISGDRRFAIFVVCALEWRSAIADAVVETHDRIVGKTWRDAKKLCAAHIADAKSALHETLCSFRNLGAALLEAKGDEASLDIATENLLWLASA